MEIPRRLHVGLVLSALLTLGTWARAEASTCDTLNHMIPTQSASARFLASYPTATADQLRGVGFTYDNALAILALIGCGRAREAAPIGDALLAALDFDRYWHDGRLRNAYPAGPASGHPVKLTGWWDTKQQRWVEDRYQVGSDTGNLAYAMLALEQLYGAVHSNRYLDAAKRIGHYLESNYDKRAPAGFSGGMFGGEPDPDRNTWKSTEHNADLAAAYLLLASQTHEHHWLDEANVARSFVETMWMASCGCFAAGTAEDGRTLNTTFALDAQILPLLAARTSARSASVEKITQVRVKRSDGVAYSDTSRGVWTEGTAQFALFLVQEGRRREAERMLSRLQRNRAEHGLYYATERAQMTTGFALQTDLNQPRSYFHLPHLGATAWVAMAETGFNPFIPH